MLTPIARVGFLWVGLTCVAWMDACRPVEEEQPQDLKDASTEASESRDASDAPDVVDIGDEPRDASDAPDVVDVGDEPRDASDAPDVVDIRDEPRDASEVADAVDSGSVLCPETGMQGKICAEGGRTCVERFSTCPWPPWSSSCYAPCVCSSTPGTWECAFTFEGGDAQVSCEGGSGATDEGRVLVADVGDAPSAMVAHGGYLYWITSRGAVSRISASGGTPEPLVAGGTDSSGFGNTITVDDDSLYWKAMGLFALPQSGGAPRPLASLTELPAKLATRANLPAIYGESSHAIVAVPKDGSAAISLFDSPALLGQALALDGANLYFDQREPHLYPPEVSPGPAEWSTVAMRKIAVNGGAAPESLAWMHRWSGGVATDGTILYWSQTQGRDDFARIRQVNTTGGEAVTLYTSELGYDIEWLGLDAQYVYFSNWQYQCKKQVRRIPKAGGSSTTLVDRMGSWPDGRPVVTLGGGKIFWVTGFSTHAIRVLDL